MTLVEDFRKTVSRETLERLEEYESLLRKWNPRINLLASSQLDIIWQRHFIDSAQIFSLSPMTTNTWFDLGTGGGFPGLVCAVLAYGRGDQTRFHLIESDQRKAVFLRQVAQALSLDLAVHAKRIEDLDIGTADVISARALASLPELLSLSAIHMDIHTKLLFLKGAKAESELTQAQQTWNMEVDRIPSQTDPEGVILRLTGVSPRT